MSATTEQLVDELHQLLHSVPRARGDTIPMGGSESELAAFAARNKLTVPSELAQYLKLSNGPCIGPGGLLGIHTSRAFLDIENVYEDFPEWRAMQWIPVAGDGCGNYYVVTPLDGRYPVVFVDTPLSSTEPAYIVASGVLRFLCCLLQNEISPSGWPFEEVTVRRVDPDIVSFGNRLPLPWQEPES